MRNYISASISLLAILALLGACSSLGNREPTVQELIRQGRTEEAKELFHTKADINSSDEDGNTALHVAAEQNDDGLVVFLVRNGAQVDPKNLDGETPLHVAVKNNCQQAAAALIGLDASLFEKDAEGRMPIEIGLAADPAFYDILITEKCASVRDVNGQSVVHYFVLRKDEKAIDVCIKKQIPLSAEDNAGITPLGLALADADDVISARIAARLLQADAAPVRGEYAYFEDAVRTHNPGICFDDGQTPLHLSSIQGKRGIVEYLLENGASLRAKDISGTTPLHEAVRYGRTDIARELIAGGADVNARDSIGKTPLLLVMPMPSAQELYAVLLGHGADPQASDMFGDTAFHIASMTELDVPALEILARSGARVNERNKHGVTPVAIAAEHNLSEHIRFYVACGADIHAEDMAGNTPLTLALHPSRMAVLKELVSASNVNSQDSSGNTPLHLAVLGNASLDAVKYLIELGADINARNKNGDSVLYTAVCKNRKDVGQILLDRGADIFATNMQNYSPLRKAFSSGGSVQDWVITPQTIRAADGNGNTPLHYAAEWNVLSAVTALLEKGADVNTANAGGETPLFSAVKAGSLDVMQLLVSRGAALNAKDYLGNTPCHIAVNWNRADALRMLLGMSADCDLKNISGKTPLSAAVRSEKNGMAELLLSAGADIDSADVTGKSIISDSVSEQRSTMVEFLLSHGANPQIQDMYGRNSLHEAVEGGDTAIVTMLRAAGCDPLSRDAHGKTPFALALPKGKNMLDAVLGNNPGLADSDGNTPLHVAVRSHCDSGTFEYVAGKGYPLNQRNSDGLSALALALQEGKTDFAQTLLAHGADPFSYDSAGESAVALAAKRHYADVLQGMVRQNKRKTDVQGNSILHIAAQYASAEEIALLLELGLDKSQRNVSNETAADVAARWNRADIADLLR